VLDRRMPYVICDVDGTPVTPDQAKKIIAERWTVPPDVRARRRSTKARAKAGKAPQQAPTGHDTQRARSTRTRGDLPRPRSSTPRPGQVKQARPDTP